MSNPVTNTSTNCQYNAVLARPVVCTIGGLQPSNDGSLEAIVVLVDDSSHTLVLLVLHVLRNGQDRVSPVIVAKPLRTGGFINALGDLDVQAGYTVSSGKLGSWHSRDWNVAWYWLSAVRFVPGILDISDDQRSVETERRDRDAHADLAETYRTRRVAVYAMARSVRLVGQGMCWEQQGLTKQVFSVIATAAPQQ